MYVVTKRKSWIKYITYIFSVSEGEYLWCPKLEIFIWLFSSPCIDLEQIIRTSVLSWLIFGQSLMRSVVIFRKTLFKSFNVNCKEKWWQFKIIDVSLTYRRNCKFNCLSKLSNGSNGRMYIRNKLAGENQTQVLKVHYI